MKKLLSFILIVFTVASAVEMPFSAAKPVEPDPVIILAADPRLNNGNSFFTGFTITNTGVASLTVQYSGISGVTSRVTATMSIEKKVSANTWERVDIGTLTNSWTDSSTELSGVFSHTFQLESTGTYRGVFVIRMFGTGGTADKIEKTIEKTYS